MKRDKKSIDNISTEGVTAQQLLIQCRYLQTTIPQSFHLSKEQISDAINDTIIKILEKMEQGVVNKYDYQEFKNYLYISLKNHLLQEYIKANRQKNKPAFDIDILDEDMFPTQEQDEIYVYNDLMNKYKPLLYEIINGLAETKKNIVLDYINGDRRVDICKRYNISKQHIYNTIRGVKRELIRRTNPIKEIQKIKPKRKPRQYIKKEYIKRTSNGRIGTKQTEETKLKISQSLKKFYNEKEK
jgi:DNA-directed RNA polymerase specialized sigma24 family protein